MTDSIIDSFSRSSKETNTLLENIKTYFENISDAEIREYYLKIIDNGKEEEEMFGELNIILDNFKQKRIPDDLNEISVFNTNFNTNNQLNSEQIKKLNESIESNEESLKLIEEIQEIVKKIMDKRLNEALIAETLEQKVRKIIKKYNIETENEMVKNLINEKYGGFRKRKNKTNNKKYSKKKTKNLKKYISKKNKTRKMKKNYL
jgi:hemoglobin-like flavoprotein